ncbi:MAG: hypothetical protein GX813_01455 [Erysipelotrichia bacterium]|nr:hypothetical protein [Erysipelotrichia bacterium]
MGLLDKLKSKVGDAMEKSMVKNLQGDSKAAYEKEKAKQVAENVDLASAQVSAKEDLQTRRVAATKAEMKNPDILLRKIGVIDENNIWIGGFANFKTKQNPIFANLLSGNKNLRILSLANGTFYLSRFEKGLFYAYKTFVLEQVQSCKIEGLINKSIRIKLNDGAAYSVAITENKDKIEDLRKVLKK